MPGYPGFDILAYPGDDSVAWLKDNTNLSWCGYYLAPAPSHDDESWMGQRATLTAAGWGLAPTYVGQQLAGPGSHVVTGPQGQLDGADAAHLMTQEGFAPGSFVYLDLEDGPPFTAPRTDYVNAWVTAVQAAGFQAGIYCSHGLAEDVQACVPKRESGPTRSRRQRRIRSRGQIFLTAPPRAADIPGPTCGNWVKTVGLMSRPTPLGALSSTSAAPSRRIRARSDRLSISGQ
jgi:Domain of unknown function (DUF1906)